MEQQSPFFALLVITLLAFAVPLLSNKVRIVRMPIVVGEILAGILIGRSGLNWVQPSPTLEFLADFGFTFLMFLSGLEVSFESLAVPAAGDDRRPRWLKPIPLSLLYTAITFILGVAVGFGLADMGLTRNPILMGLVLSTTSLGIVVPTLKEHGRTTSAYGQTVLVAALISDFVTLLLLSLILAVYRRGFSLDIFLFLVLLGAFMAAAQLGRWVNKIPVFPKLLSELSHATAQIQVRGSFALMVIWVVLAQSMGVEIILGAFLAGAIMSASGQGHESPLRAKLDAIGYGFFIPIFFITVGAEFDLRNLIDSRAALLLVPLLIGAAYLIKLLPALVFRFRFSWRRTIAAGFLLSSRLSLIIAVSAIALSLDLISPVTNAAILLVAVVTCTFSPLLFARILPPEAAPQRRGVLILGADQLSMLLGARLRQGGEEVTFVTADPQAMEGLAERGFAGIPGDPEDENVLAKAGALHARALIAMSRDPQKLLSVCRSARGHFQIPNVIARADDRQLVRELERMKVSVVQPAMAVALALEGALHFPAAFSVLMDKGDNVDVLDVPLENLRLDGRPLRRLRLPGDALVLGIQRQGEVLVPHGDTVVWKGDTLMLVGSPEALREASTILGETG